MLLLYVQKNVIPSISKQRENNIDTAAILKQNKIQFKIQTEAKQNVLCISFINCLTIYLIKLMIINSTVL